MSAATQTAIASTLPPLKRLPVGKFVPHSLAPRTVTRFFGVDPSLGLSTLEVADRWKKAASHGGAAEAVVLLLT